MRRLDFDALKKLDKKSPYYKYIRAEILFHWGINYATMDKQRASIRRLRKCYKLLERNVKKHPDFLPQYKTLGLAKLGIMEIPDSYRWAVRLAGLKGDSAVGASYLKKALADTSPVQQESYLFYVVGEFLKTDNFDDLRLPLDSLNQENPENLLIAMGSASMALQNRDGEKALAILEGVPIDERYLDFSFYYSVLGYIQLRQLNYDDAIGSFNRYLKEYKGQNLIKTTHYRLFQAYYLQGKDSLARREIELIRSEGRTFYSTDKDALFYAHHFQLLHPQLERAGLLFNGGQYDSSLAILDTFIPRDGYYSDDQGHYFYLMALNYWALEEYEMAKEYAFKAVNVLPELSYYHYMPRSYYLMAYAYNKQGNYEEALKAIKKALSFEDYWHKESLKPTFRRLKSEIKKNKKKARKE